VKLLYNIVIGCFLPGRAILLLVGVLLLSACATTDPQYAVPPPLLSSAPERQLADIDVLAVTPEMTAFLERYILPYDDLETRLQMLMLAVTSSGVLGFDYEDDRTLTSAEAFKTRSGNCIGFANMMIALAREAGLEAEYQEIFRRPEWSSREDTLLVIKHINVVVSSPRYSYVIDVSGVKFDSNERRKIISDAYAKALFYTNIGAEALLVNEFPTAWGYLVKAIDTEATLADPWVNLGVIYSRNDQLDDAIQVYQTALQIDPAEYSAMNNLYEVYIVQEDLEAAENLEARVEKYRERNPYYLMMLSEESLELGKYQESMSLLKRAIRKKDNDHLLYFAMAKTQYLSGETEAAQSSLHRVRELAPQDMLSHYNRPLHDLVMEDQAAAKVDTSEK